MYDDEMNIVTEVGTFGDLDINDPTATKVKKKKKEIDELIQESIKENANNLA